MATFVLVHGGWAGGWQWREVASLLCAAGHDVFTPTLTGLGERVHLASPDVGLDTHIQDILMVLEYKELRDVSLVGYSYSGMVITGVAELAPERISQLIYLDAFVPQDGQSMLEMLGPDVAAFVHRWRGPTVTAGAFHTTRLMRRNTRRTPSRPSNSRSCSRTRPRQPCPGHSATARRRKRRWAVGAPITQAAKHARSDVLWRYRELQTGHSPWETAPRELASLLLEEV